MAIVSEKEIFDRNGRRGFFSANFTENRVTRQFRILVDDVADDPLTILANTAVIPVQYTPHPSNSAYLLKQATIEPQDAEDWQVWIAELTYDTAPVSIEQSDPNPLNWDTRISWSGRRVPHFTVRDRNNFPVTNSAGDFLSPWDIGRGQLVARVRKNLSAVPTFLATLQNTVNDAQVTVDGIVMNAREAFLEDGFTISETQNVDDNSYREVTFNIVYDPRGHDVPRLDEGTREKGPPGTGTGLNAMDRVRIKNDDGSYVTDPVPLDGMGFKLDDPDPTNAVIIAPNGSGVPTAGNEVEYIPEADWSPMIAVF